MLINEVTIHEAIDNYLPGDEEQKRAIAPEVFDMIQTAYAPIGGMKGGGFEDPESMVQNIPMWKVFRRGDDIKAAMMYKDRGGRKRVAIATDGSYDSRKMLANMLRAEYTQSRAFSEISGPSLKFHQKLLGDEFDNITVPVEQVKQILPNDEIEAVDEYEYKRLVNGNWLNKRMVGTPGKTVTNRS